MFVDLLRAPRFFAPSGIPEGLLGDQFLVVDSDAERKLLGSFLGVGQLELAAFFRGHVFPRVKEGGCDPEVVASAFLDLLLHRLPEMEGADRGFGEALSDIPFVPTRSGELKAPSRSVCLPSLVLAASVWGSKFTIVHSARPPVPTV